MFSALAKSSIRTNYAAASKFKFNSIQNCVIARQRVCKTNLLTVLPSRSVQFTRSPFPNTTPFPQRHGGHSHAHFPLRTSGKPLTPEQIKENQAAERITWLGLASNVLMSIVKAVVGIVGNSTAMVADAAHNLGDLIADVVTLVSLRFSRKPVDLNHPHGHGRFETVGALTVGALLIGTGIGIGHHSIEHLLHPEATPTMLTFWVALGSIIVKEALFQMTMYVGKKQNSQLLMANAWHHRGDAISSVVALLGIAGARIGYPELDPIAGLAVAGLIVKIGVDTCWESLKELTDTLTDTSIVKEINDVAMKVTGVSECSNIRTRKMGHYTNIDLTIHVEPDLSVLEGHKISKEVERVLKEKIERASEVLISVVPNDHHHHDDEHHNHHHGNIEEIEKEIKQVVGNEVKVNISEVNHKIQVELFVNEENSEKNMQLAEQIKIIKDVDNVNIIVNKNL